jgi:hypothetical protein
MIRDGQDIDYVGAYSTLDFDAHGDPQGQLVYDVYDLPLEAAGFIWKGQRVIDTTGL